MASIVVVQVCAWFCNGVLVMKKFAYSVRLVSVALISSMLLVCNHYFDHVHWIRSITFTLFREHMEWPSEVSTIDVGTSILLIDIANYPYYGNYLVYVDGSDKDLPSLHCTQNGRVVSRVLRDRAIRRTGAAWIVGEIEVRDLWLGGDILCAVESNVPRVLEIRLTGQL